MRPVFDINENHAGFEKRSILRIFIG